MLFVFDKASDLLMDEHKLCTGVITGMQGLRHLLELTFILSNLGAVDLWKAGVCVGKFDFLKTVLFFPLVMLKGHKLYLSTNLFQSLTSCENTWETILIKDAICMQTDFMPRFLVEIFAFKSHINKYINSISFISVGEIILRPSSRTSASFPTWCAPHGTASCTAEYE